MQSEALILNVDDSDAKRYVKTRLLTQAGYRVLEAGNAADARSIVEVRAPDLVLLDVKLPDGDGRELCAWIKSRPHPSVVLQTSACLIESSDKVAGLDAGADGYLIEPIETEELVATVRALLRLRQAEHERQAAMSALREADRRKDEFLAMLAHELRNPLAPIRNAVEILKTEDRAVRERARTIIGRQVGHLSRLVDDLLEVSRITQRKVVLRRTSVQLSAILEAAMETARPYIEGRGQELRVDVPAADLWLDVDAVRLSQVLGNLLHNASKFTPRGGRVTLEACLDGDTLVLAVSDNGVGITADMLPSVFDLFIQDERSLARSEGGLGIGLSLVRGMVEMHGGTVEAQSAGRGLGSTFTIRLPLSQNVSAAPRQARSTPLRPHLARRILVVEDNDDAAESLVMLLEPAGHQVVVAMDAVEALQRSRESRPDVILLDIGLPGMDGYELAARLRRQPETHDACLIALSGYGQERDRARSAAAGFDRHLTKPVEPSQLAEAIAFHASPTTIRAVAD